MGNLSGKFTESGTGIKYYRLPALFLIYGICRRRAEAARDMKNGRDFLIITNNPLVERCLREYYEVSFLPDESYRGILVLVRDKIYLGHKLYTHPLSGSVKPNETPYKSVVISEAVHGFDAGEAEIISNCIAAFDKFSPRKRPLSDKILNDFQLIDYTLLCGALDYDAAAGLSKINTPI